MAIVGRSPGGRPLGRRREAVLVYGRPRLRGTAALRAPPIIVATTRWPLLADPLGRPLRRRREAVLVYGRPRLRGTAALQAPTDHRCLRPDGHCWPILWRASAR